MLQLVTELLGKVMDTGTCRFLTQTTKYFGQSSAFSTQKDTCKSLTPGILAISLPMAIKCSKSLATPIANRSWSPTVFVAKIMFRIRINFSRISDDSVGVVSVARMCVGEASIVNVAKPW